VTFPVRLAACRQAAVERERPASVRPVAPEHPVVVALEHRAELVHLQAAVHSVAVAVVVQAVAAAEQTRSMR
jgi:hypothetical protein